MERHPRTTPPLDGRGKLTDATQHLGGETLQSVGRPLPRAAPTMALARDLAPYSAIEIFNRKIYNSGDALGVFVWGVRIGQAARHECILSDLVLGLQKSSPLHSQTRVVPVDDQ